MMVWKLASRPLHANSARSLVPTPDPKIARNPRNNGSFDVPTFAAPGGIPAFRITVRNEHTISVAKPYRIPRGMSREGSCDSSVARGNCSMPKYNHSAKGRFTSTPADPWGNHDPPSRAQRRKSNKGIAPTKKTAKTARAQRVTITETQNDTSTPTTFSMTNKT